MSLLGSSHTTLHSKLTSPPPASADQSVHCHTSRPSPAGSGQTVATILSPPRSALLGVSQAWSSCCVRLLCPPTAGVMEEEQGSGPLPRQPTLAPFAPADRSALEY